MRKISRDEAESAKTLLHRYRKQCAEERLERQEGPKGYTRLYVLDRVIETVSTLRFDQSELYRKGDQATKKRISAFRNQIYQAAMRIEADRKAKGEYK